MIDLRHSHWIENVGVQIQWTGLIGGLKDVRHVEEEDVVEEIGKLAMVTFLSANRKGGEEFGGGAEEQGEREEGEKRKERKEGDRCCEMI